MTLDEWERLDETSRTSVDSKTTRDLARQAAEDFLDRGYFSAEEVILIDRYGEFQLMVGVPEAVYDSLAPGWDNGGYESTFRGFHFDVRPLSNLYCFPFSEDSCVRKPRA